MAQPSNPKIPFREGTKKYLLAKRLIAGDEDDELICRELGIKKATLWNVRSELRKLGLLKRGNSETPPTQSPHQNTEKTDSPQSSPNPQQTLESEPKQKPNPTSELPELSSELISEIARKVADYLGKEENPKAKPLSGVMPLEAEDVEVVGEKVNYKVALNPEIFWRYSVFKAEAERRGRQWNGSFSDFLDLATKDILAVYGIHPTVLSMKGKKLMVELPVEVERETA
jgi:hypothetical protein